MKKAKFRNIRPIPLDSFVEGKKAYIKASIETIYEETLIICVYAIQTDRKQEGYRCIFQQFITENDFVAINYYDSDDGKWSESVLLRFIEDKRWGCEIDNKYGGNNIKCATDQDNDVINKYYQTKFGVGVNLINHHQTELRKSALYYKYDIERRELMRIHDQVIYLPADMHDWISDAIAKDNAKYFFETVKKSKLKRGICSYCKSESTLKEAKHNDYGMCPSCNTKVQFKGLNRAKYYEDFDYFAFAQRIDSGIMIRRFKVKLEYKSPTKKTDIKTIGIFLNELSRSVLEESKPRSVHYEFGEFIREEYRWKKEENSYAGYYGNGSVAEKTRSTYMRLYPFNLKDVISGTKWEYCAIEMFKGKIDPMDYFEFEENRLIEMLVRRGFNKIAQDMINDRYSSKSTYNKIEYSKTMGLSEYAYFMAKKYDLGLKELSIIKTIENDFNVKASLEQVIWLTNEYGKSGTIFKIMKHATLQRIINYVEKKSREEHKNLSEVIIEWHDYLNASVKLNYSLEDEILLFPRNLEKAHDEVMIKVNSEHDKAHNVGVKKYAKRYKWLNFNKNGLEIKVASDVSEIHKESQILGHCVGRSSYIEQMAKGDTLILTIRKVETPDIPYFTVEVNPETFEVRQYESKKRLRKSEDIDKFLIAWKKHVNKKALEPKKTINLRSSEYEHRIAN